jgi:excisionase family DNA binding protein
MTSNALLSTAKVAEQLGLTKQTIILYAENGRIPASFFGRKWRFRQSDIDRFVDAQRRGR